MKKLLLLLLTMLITTASMAATLINGIYYELSSYYKTAEVAEAEVIDYSGSVSIPSKVTYNGTQYSVTGIGKQAFSGCSVTSVSIPSSVTYIKDQAFSGCSDLTTISIPSSVTSLGKRAFYYCSSLTSITIPNSVTSIGDQAFNGCSTATSLSIGSGMTNIDIKIFNGCSNISTITVASGNSNYDSRNNSNAIIEKSTNKLILGCKNTTIPNSVTIIGDQAFSNCSGLTSITIPSSVTSIGNTAFYYCTGLTSITIPSSVTSIGVNTFGNCSSMTSVIIGNGVTSIGSAAFSYCTGLTSITIPSSVTSIGVNAFSNCTGLNSISVASGNTKYDSRNNCNAIIEKSSNTLIAGCKNTVIPYSVTSIGGSAFFSCSGLTSITIPSEVTSIGSLAFYSCSNLTSVTVENPTPITITSGVFSNYDNATLYVPYGSKTAYEAATYWQDFNAIVEVDNRSEQTLSYSGIPTKTYGDAAFTLPSTTTEGLTITWTSSNTNVATISGNTVTIKGAGTATITATQAGNSNYKPFTKDYTLTVTKAPLTITAKNYTIKQGDPLPTFEATYSGFKNGQTASVLTTQPTFSCNATSSSAPGTYTITPSGAAATNYTITYVNGTLTIEEPIITFADANVKALCVANWDTNGDGELSEEEAAAVTDLGTVFKSKSNITSFNELQYFTRLTSIGSLAFYYSSLTSITIPNSVTSIGGSAFANCSRLTSITIPDGVTSIGMWAFDYCNSLTSVDIPNSVTSIGFGAFEGCKGLTSITIPNSVTNMGEQAFSGCSGLTSINVASGNTVYDSRDNCNAIIETASNTLIAGCKNTAIPSNVTSIGNYAFSFCYFLTSVTIPNSVTSIGNYAFQHCNSLTSITIPNSVTSIGNDAFYGCSGLTSVDIGSGVTSIGSYAFDYCSGLTSISIPNSVTSIGEGAFSSCSGLTSVTVENPTPVTIDSYTFTNRANATLYVPYGSKSAYENANYWKEFKQIIEIDNRPEQSLSYSGIPTKTYGDAAVTLPSTTAQQLTITWTSSNTNIATISGNTLTIKGAGTATITATQAGNNSYKPFTQDYTLTVNKAPLTVTAKSYTITQGNALPTFEATYSGFKNGETTNVLTTQPTFTCSATSSSAPGTYTITPKGAAAANYSFTYANGTLTIMGNQGIDLTELPAMTYGDAAYTLPETTTDGLTITWASSNTNVATVSGHTLTIKNAGTATITATQAGNSIYNAFSKTYTLTVNKAPLTVTAKSYTITQGNALPTFEATYSGFKNGETTSVLTTQPTFTCSATSNSAPGTYTITPKGAAAANYSFTYANGTLTIMGNQGIDLTELPAMTYGDAAYTLPETTTDGLTITWSSSNTNVATVSGNTLTVVGAGTATITATQAGNSNYNAFSKTYTLTVNKAPLTVTAKSYTITQGNALPTFEATYSGFKNGETTNVLTTQPTFTCSATSNSAPGTYTITPKGAAAANYSLTYANGTLTIMGNQGIDLTELPAMTYGDAAYTLPETTTDGLTITWASDNTNVATISGNTLTVVGAGTATITATQAGSNIYNALTQDYTLTVVKAPLAIIADDYERETGENNPSFTLTYEGFVNGDDATCLTTAPTVTCTATAESAPGTYTIRVSGAESPNYDISYVNGTLTVNQAYSTTCALTVAPVTIHTGTTTTLSISLDNEEPLVAFEFDLQLPESVSIATDDDGYFDVILNSTRNNRHSLEVSNTGDGLYHFLCYSNSNNAFKGNSGELLHMTLTCDEELTPDTYQATISTVKFIKIVNANEEYVRLHDVDFDIEVSDVLMGDVNGDGDIDVMDVVMMVSYIMGNHSPRFIYAAGNHDGNNEIDVMDLVKEVTLVMSQSAAHAPASNYEQLSGALSLRSCHDGSITLDIAGNDHYVASQFVVTLAEGQRLAAVTTDGRHTVTYERIADDKYAVVCYSNANNTFASNEGILNLYVTGRGNVGLENVLFVNTSDERVAFQSILSSFTDGIGSLVLDPSNPADIYSISGALVRKAATSTQGIQSGVYIVNGKKAVVK